MKFLIIDTYYPAFLNTFYGRHPDLAGYPFEQQWRLLMDQCFGTADFYLYTEYGLPYLAKESGLVVVDLIPTSGLWATLTQRVADTVVNTYCAGRSRWVILVLSLLLASVLMMGYGLDRLCGKRGDTLDHVMVEEKATDS